jgi:hypothetical protein
MATVAVTFTLKKQSVPAAPAASGNVKCYLKQGETVLQTVTTAVSALTASFPNVADGDYTVALQRMSMSNTPLGDMAVSAPFTVVNMALVDVPDVVSVAL